METRSGQTRERTKKTDTWLIGELIPQINDDQLPSSRQVLSLFLYHHLNGETISQSAELTTEEVLLFWQATGIPTRQSYHIKKKVTNLFSKWQGLKKNCLRETVTQKKNEEQFEDSLEDLFDVAHGNEKLLMTSKEHINFLNAQRKKGRQGHWRSLKELRREKSGLEEEEELDENTETYESVSRQSSAQKSSYESDEDYRPPSPKKCKKTSLLTANLSTILDRTLTSNRAATSILAAAAHSLGHQVQDIIVNRETLRKRRCEFRTRIAEEIKEHFSPHGGYTVHWDSKLLRDVESTDSSDRLVVLISGQNGEKLLGVPVIDHSSGESQANGVFELLNEWNVADSIHSMSFDTTASNTGKRIGACTLLEERLGRKLLRLPCRHHILELVASAAFSELLEVSSGPNIKLFVNFRNEWSQIDSSSFETNNLEVSREIISFINNQLKQFQPREDYKELLQLALIYVGELSAHEVTIRVPGAFHRARWMAKLIYCLKIYIFRDQFKLSKHQIRGLQEFNSFIIKIYLQAWYTCQSAAAAPRNDLQFLKNLKNYEEINKEVATVTLKSFSRHLSYLNEYLIGLAFFDDEVSIATKVKMVSSLKKSGSKNVTHDIKIKESDILGKNLEDFVTENTNHFVTTLHIPQEFLKHHPKTWGVNEDFLLGKEIVSKLKVVNDTAERGVALIETYNKTTRNEEQKQFLLQVIEKNRKKLPNSNKDTLINFLNE